jgi:hydroxymethylpyrimidine/phosphomethylpyrimidine kinase
LSDFSVDALCVVTAVTAQSDHKVTAVHHVPPEVIRAQIAAALATRHINAIKIGMLGTQATVEAVVEGLLASRPEAVSSAASAARLPGVSRGESWLPSGVPIVLDPVLVSTSGGVLLDASGRAALTRALFPHVTVVTPNVPEAAALLGEAIATNEAELVQQGQRLLNFGCGAILLKGGHSYAGHVHGGGGDGEEAVDVLMSRRTEGVGPADARAADRVPVEAHDARGADGHATDRAAEEGYYVERIVSKRLAGSSRGTGCALASAIAAGLAAGQPLIEACRAAKGYVLNMLRPLG